MTNQFYDQYLTFVHSREAPYDLTVADSVLRAEKIQKRGGFVGQKLPPLQLFLEKLAKHMALLKCLFCAWRLLTNSHPKGHFFFFSLTYSLLQCLDFVLLPLGLSK